MRFIINSLLFVGIIVSLVVIAELLPHGIFQYYIWIAHVFLCCNISLWIVIFSQDYLLTAKVNPKNKAILITGCDTGFGNSMAKIFESRGYKIFACCLHKNSVGASELKDMDSPNLTVIQMDVTDERSVERAVKFVKDNLDKSELWAVVNNAGVVKGFQTELSRTSDFDLCLRVNTLGMIRVTKAFLPMLRKSKGRVVNICSLGGRMRFPFMNAYTVSKSAAVAFSETLCHEMREFGVRVISIEPEIFKTPMNSSGYLTDVLKESLSEVDEELISAYGNDYIEKAKKIYCDIFSNGSHDIKRVYDAIEAAVSLQYPCDVYRPMRDIYRKILFMASERVPLVLSEIFFKIGLSVMGLPTPKDGLHFLSKLKVL